MSHFASAVSNVMRRELAGYFATPVAWVFIVIFLVMAGAFTFYIGAFYDRGVADLDPFFTFHPWLYLFLVPAIAMRLWAEERRSGTIELLLTLPLTPWQAVLGKFLAAWAFSGIALALTFPTWITVNYLGDPDNGAIAAAYVGSFLMAGGFLAIGSCISALTKNQVIAFVLGAAACAMFVYAGSPSVIGTMDKLSWVPKAAVSFFESSSFLTHYDNMERGLIAFSDVFFLAAVTIGFLVATVFMLKETKAR